MPSIWEKIRSVLVWSAAALLAGLICVPALAASTANFRLIINPADGISSSGTVYPPQTTVGFFVTAYRDSLVTLLKDGQVAVTAVADQNGRAQLGVSNLAEGNYVFSLYAVDAAGRRSSPLTFPLVVPRNMSTAVNGLVVPPILAADKDSVKKGDILTVSGRSAPYGGVNMVVSDGWEGTLIADNQGLFSWRLNTALMDPGPHWIKARTAVASDEQSPYGYLTAFDVVAVRPVLQPSVQGGPVTGDLNKDSRVDLIDFSILAYWYKRPNPPVSADLNGDGVVNLVDFSILAYNWTG